MSRVVVVAFAGERRISLCSLIAIRFFTDVSFVVLFAALEAVLARGDITTVIDASHLFALLFQRSNALGR